MKYKIDVTVYIRETKSHWQLTGITASCYMYKGVDYINFMFGNAQHWNYVR